jgi:hypothetical protein
MAAPLTHRGQTLGRPGADREGRAWAGGAALQDQPTGRRRWIRDSAARLVQRRSPDACAAGARCDRGDPKAPAAHSTTGDGAMAMPPGRRRRRDGVRARRRRGAPAGWTKPARRRRASADAVRHRGDDPGEGGQAEPDERAARHGEPRTSLRSRARGRVGRRRPLSVGAAPAPGSSPPRRGVLLHLHVKRLDLRSKRARPDSTFPPFGCEYTLRSVNAPHL